MIKPDETRNGSGTIGITDDEIRRSLLGCASASEQEKFETQLLLDDQFEQRVERLELELSDDFSFGRLTQNEQELFSKNFLVDSKRARHLAVSQALHKTFSVGQPQQLESGWRPSLPAFAMQRPFVSTAIAATVIVLLGGLVSWRVLKTRTVRPQLIAKQVTATDPGREFSHPVSPAPTNNSAGGSELLVVASLTLQPDEGSSTTETLHWSPPSAEQDRVRFELVVAGDPSGTYQARLLGPGSQITSHYDLKPEGSPPRVSFTIAPNLVPPGDYQIELVRSSEGKILETSRYSFRSREE